VRPVVPKYVLRGVSGVVFGRNIPVHGTVTIGRAPECSLSLDEPGLSRMHARLMPTDHGLLLEDMGSSNGSTINGHRVLRGEVRCGDEIGFDTLRFRLLSSGHVESVQNAVRAAGRKRSGWGWVALAVAVLVAALAGIAAAVLVGVGLIRGRVAGTVVAGIRYGVRVAVGRQLRNTAAGEALPRGGAGISILARRLVGLAPAARIAAVACLLVSIIALLAGIEHSIAAARRAAVQAQVEDPAFVAVPLQAGGHADRPQGLDEGQHLEP
jgi:hypothetical protein